jgi:hypothetical protein
MSSLDAARRRRGHECLSDLQLDQRLVEEAQETQVAARIDAHLATCLPCRQAADRIAADRDAFLAEAAAPTLAALALATAGTRPAQPLPWLRRLAPLTAGAVGLTAALVLFLPRAPDPGTRTKGGFAIGAYVQHDAQSAGERHAGERLRLVVSSSEAGHLAVIGVDEARHVSVYYPRGERAGVLPAARELALDSAIELDGTLGREWIIAVRCATTLPIAAVTAAARKALDGLTLEGADRGSALGTLPRLDLPCVEARYEILKAPAGSTSHATPGR